MTVNKTRGFAGQKNRCTAQVFNVAPAAAGCAADQPAGEGGVGDQLFGQLGFEVARANAIDVDAFGYTHLAFSFAGIRDGNIIVGAQSEEYLLADIDVDTSISAQISYIDEFGTMMPIVLWIFALIYLKKGNNEKL